MKQQYPSICVALYLFGWMAAHAEQMCTDSQLNKISARTNSSNLWLPDEEAQDIPLTRQNLLQNQVPQRNDFKKLAPETFLKKDALNLDPKKYPSWNVQSQNLSASKSFYSFKENKLNKVDENILAKLHVDPSTMMGMPGTAAPHGKELPGKGPVVFDRIEKCYWNASPFNLNPTADGYTPTSYSRQGFSEVGALIHKSITAKEVKYNICGFTLINPSWAVTSLHCISKKSLNSAELQDVTQTTGSDSYFFFSPDVARYSEQQSLLNCIDKKPGRVCTAIQIRPIRAHHMGDLTWTGGVPKIDLALIELDPKTTNGLPYVPPQLDLQHDTKVTVAGYGITNVATKITELLVGWQKNGVISSEDGLYLWKRTAGTNGTSQCIGDSGSAVFAGEFFGRKEEQKYKKLMAVMSYVKPKPADEYEAAARDCIKVETENGSVLLATYKDRICETASNIAGCNSVAIH